MMKYYKQVHSVFKVWCLCAILSISYFYTHGQEQDEYTKVITERAQKIVDKLAGLDGAKGSKVRDIIVSQYRGLNAIDTEIDGKEQGLSALSKEQAATEKQKLEDQRMAQRASLHQQYLNNLGAELTADQVDQVKNEMTYNVLPITYKGYLEMLPALTDIQKKQILSYLTEARELAMDGGSSKEKHAWFGKYKGRINNYLSKEGVETKIARQEWEKKLKERQQQAK